MGLEIEYLPGQTPLDEDERDGLLVSTISMRGELDEFEQKNIEDAIQWLLPRTLQSKDIFTEEFVRDLHAKMYGKVWKWAGEFRHSEKNIGVNWWEIPVTLRKLLDDSSYWFEHSTFPPDEMAIRFKHRIVNIHCFPNGNGRHSRLMADVIIEKLYNLPVFTWGSGDIVQQGDPRTIYLNAIYEADRGEINALMSFART